MVGELLNVNVTMKLVETALFKSDVRRGVREAMGVWLLAGSIPQIPCPSASLNHM